MAKGIFKLSGIEDYLEKIQDAGYDVVDAAKLAVDAGSAVILDEMLARVPVDTHNLQNHVNQEMKIDGDYVSAEIGVLNADAETARYGNVQEFGSSSMPAHPYVRPAFDAGRAAARRAMKNALKGFIGE